MYATGSREELYALVRHIKDNHRIALSMLTGDVDATEIVGTGLLFAHMLEDALNDHFNGRN